MSQKYRIAWFSVLNQAAEGASTSAYFSEKILPGLRNRFDIELFYDGFDRYQDYTTHHYLHAFERHAQNPFDLFFYQLEDRKCSYFTRIHQALVPGIVLFHDFFLSDDGPEPILNSPWEKVINKFHDPTLLWPDRSEEHKREKPLAYREAGMAVLPIFINERDYSECQRLVTKRLSGEKPYFLPLPVDSNIRASGQQGTAQRILFGASPRIEHRAHHVLEAIKQCEGKTSRPLQLHWLVADDRDQLAHARNLLEEFDLTSAQIEAGLTPSRWQALVNAAPQDAIAVHTLFSAYGHLQPYIGMSLMAGLRAVTIDFGVGTALSDSVVYKVRPGFSEVPELREVFLALANSPAQSHELANRYAHERYATQTITTELAKIFERGAGRIKNFAASWNNFEKEAKRSLLEEVRRHFLAQGSGDSSLVRTHWDQVLAPIFTDLGWTG